MTTSNLAKQIRGVHHVGITVENMAKSIEFYTEVLGGKLIAEVTDIAGDGMQNTLLQKEEIDAESTHDPVPDLRTGKDKLDIFLIQFDNLIIELLQYRDAADQPKSSQAFPAKHKKNGPAYVNSMHISFLLNEDVDVNAFVTHLEEECQKRGMSQVRCNRIIQVHSEKERQTTDPQYNSFKITGQFEGWTMFYCKGPDGEQLEFNQLIGKSKQFFEHSKDLAHLYS